MANCKSDGWQLFVATANYFVQYNIGMDLMVARHSLLYVCMYCTSAYLTITQKENGIELSIMHRLSFPPFAFVSYRYRHMYLRILPLPDLGVTPKIRTVVP